MSERLAKFLAEWLRWVEEGATEDGSFLRSRGLCSNFDDWMYGRNVSIEDITCENDRLYALFKADGLDGVYPFGGAEAFFDAADSETQHENQARIDWVRSKVEQFATANAK